MATVLYMIMGLLLIMGGITDARGTTKLIINSDGSDDDLLAIMLAVRSNQFEIMAITCSHGTGRAIDAMVDIIKILRLLDRTDIPVHYGEEFPLLGNPLMSSVDYLNTLRTGDSDLDEAVVNNVKNLSRAPSAIVELIKKYPNKITLISLAPLTNIAKAIINYETILLNVKEFYIAASDGTVIDGSDMEYYYKKDVESLKVVLTKELYQRTVTIIPTMEDSMSKQIDYEQVLNAMNSELRDFLKERSIAECSTVQQFWQPIAAITMAIALNKELITNAYITTLDIKGDGSEIIEQITHKPNAKIVLDYNKYWFKIIYMSYLWN